MRKSIITAALFLGFSAIGFSQARGTVTYIDNEKVTGTVSVSSPGGHFGDGLHVWSGIVYNAGTTLAIGKIVFLHPNGAIVNGKSEFVGKVTGWLDENGTPIKMTFRARDHEEETDKRQ